MNNQKRFIVPLVWGIVALLAVGLVSYIYLDQQQKQRKIDVNQVENNIDATSNSSTTEQTQSGSNLSPIESTQDASSKVSTNTSANIKLSDSSVALAVDPQFKENNGVFTYSSDHGWHTSINKIYRGDLNNDGYEDAVAISTSCSASCGSGISFVINQKDGTGKVLKGIQFPVVFQFVGAGKTYVKNIVINNGIISITAQGFSDQPDWNTVLTKKFKLEGSSLAEVNLVSIQNKDTSNWKTYDSGRGFSIQYPSDASVDITQENQIDITSKSGKIVTFLPKSTKGSVTIEMEPSEDCNDTSSGVDLIYKTINGVSFKIYNLDRVMSRNIDVSARMYCTVNNIGTEYKLITVLPYLNVPVDVDTDAVLNQMVASFKVFK